MTRKQLKRQVRNTRAFRQIAKRRDAVRIAVEKAQKFIAVREYLYGDTLEYKLEGGME